MTVCAIAKVHGRHDTAMRSVPSRIGYLGSLGLRFFRTVVTGDDYTSL